MWMMYDPQYEFMEKEEFIYFTIAKERNKNVFAPISNKLNKAEANI